MKWLFVKMKSDYQTIYTTSPQVISKEDVKVTKKEDGELLIFLRVSFYSMYVNPMNHVFQSTQRFICITLHKNQNRIPWGPWPNFSITSKKIKNVPDSSIYLGKWPSMMGVHVRMHVINKCYIFSKFLVGLTHLLLLSLW